jgi:hypothetical protein
MPRSGLARKADGTPTKKTQRNFTDADSHLMQSGGAYLQRYNCQVAVDSDHQVIVAVGMSNQTPDVEHLEPILQRIATTVGTLPDVMTMDAGYWSENKAIVEPVNGQIKEASGLRRFLLRGLEKVDGEWSLITATHNLLKLLRYRRSQQQALVGAQG